jgi:putative transposase
MPKFKRAHIPGGTFFFTVVTYNRRPLFQHSLAQQLLGDAIRECQQNWPFEINAIVLLPDHLHAIWTLPEGDDRFSARWSLIKKGFTNRFRGVRGKEATITVAQQREGRAGYWQPRFWEHTLEDEKDFEKHFDYIHFNPVKHGYVKCPQDWGPSSFHRWVRQEVYDENWACGESPQWDFTMIEKSCGEPE